MPVSVAILLLVLAAVAFAIEPHLPRRRAELEPTPDRQRLGLAEPEALPISSGFRRRDVTGQGRSTHSPFLPLPESYELLPGHRRYRQLAAVIPTREQPYDHEIEGL